jgi:hypothetical protein
MRRCERAGSRSLVWHCHRPHRWWVAYAACGAALSCLHTRSSCVLTALSCLHVRSSCVLTALSCLHVRSSCVLMALSCLHTRSSCVLTALSCLHARSSCVPTALSCLHTRSSCVLTALSCLHARSSCVPTALSCLHTRYSGPFRIGGALVDLHHALRSVTPETVREACAGRRLSGVTPMPGVKLWERRRVPARARPAHARRDGPGEVGALAAWVRSDR